MSLGAISWQDVAIADGAALSAAVKLSGRRIIGIQQDANCEGTAFGLQACPTVDGTYVSVYNTIQESTGAAPVTALWEVAKSATVAQIIMLPQPFQYEGLPFIKIQTENGSNAAANQTGAQTIRVFTQEEFNGTP